MFKTFNGSLKNDITKRNLLVTREGLLSDIDEYMSPEELHEIYAAVSVINYFLRFAML